MVKKEFFEFMNSQHLALTFDDVRLKTGYSETLPDNVKLESRFSRNVALKIPIVSAAMDTVTDHTLAIELAKLGGIGVIHRNLTPEQQASEVSRVKHHLNGLIEKPITVYDDDTIEFVLARRKQKDYTFHTFPVINRENGKLVGILSKNDFDFCDNNSLYVRDIMTEKVFTAGKDTTLDDAYGIMINNKKKVLPLVSEEGNITGMYVFSDLKRIKTVNSDIYDYNLDIKGRLIVAAAIGVYDDAFSRLEELIRKDVDLVVIDTAHGDSNGVIETLKEIKRRYNIDVVVGNLSEGSSAKRLINAGADGIKVGQGPGSICTTRVIAGIGCPQVTAIYNCAISAEEYGIPVCADGGLIYSGDIPIAIGAGAHSVMLGMMLAGTKESPGEFVFKEGRQWKSYRGMGSIGAILSNQNPQGRYGQKNTEGTLVPEGIEGLIPYRGELSNVIFQYIGGLRRGMGYVGAASIDELRTKADFYRLSSAGKAESHPHDVLITKEAPNYSR